MGTSKNYSVDKKIGEKIQESIHSVTINYKDGELYTGQEMHVGFSVSLTQIFEIGFGEEVNNLWTK